MFLIRIRLSQLRSNKSNNGCKIWVQKFIFVIKVENWKRIGPLIMNVLYNTVVNRVSQHVFDFITNTYAHELIFESIQSDMYRMTSFSGPHLL